MAQSKYWIATLMADSAQGEDKTWLCPGIPCPVGVWLDSADIDYLVCQVERCPDTGRVHLHAYIQFSRNKRLAALKKLNARADWEVRRGTHEQAKAYCTKTESRVNGPWELGQEKVPSQGKRNDLIEIGALVAAKKSNEEILETLGASCSRFSKQIDWLRFVGNEKDSDRQLQGVRVIVLYGPTGRGKTYAAVNYIAGNKDYYICEAPSHSTSKVWFDGYQGQRCLILDDFAGGFCQFRFLLRLLDKYKLKVEIKGGHAWAIWTTVVITSNHHPSEWYKDVDLAPLERRIQEIRFADSQGYYQLMDWSEHPVGDLERYQLPPSLVGPPSVPLATPPARDPSLPPTDKLTPTAPWPGHTESQDYKGKEKEKEHEVIDVDADCCDPDLVFDD